MLKTRTGFMEVAASPTCSRSTLAWRESLATLEKRPSLQFALLLLVAFAVRAPLFGDWTYHTDEQFYFLVGQRLLDGDLLYVDIWDRKGPALFLLYASLAAISRSVLSYQIAATVAAALTAFAITRMAARLTDTRYAILSGVAYFALIAHFGGGGGQSPVFYNALMIAAAYAIATSLEELREGRIPLRVYAGITGAGLAIAFKATAVFEGFFFGAAIVACLWKARCKPSFLLSRVALLALLAAGPMLLTFAFFAMKGHLPEAWNALVLSNFHRAYETPLGRVWRAGVVIGRLGLMLFFAGIGWRLAWNDKAAKPMIVFVGSWAFVALGSILLFPNIYLHYALPALPPLCILVACYFARGIIGLGGFLIILVMNFSVSHTLNPDYRQQARASGQALADYVRGETPRKKLLVYSSANYLYALTGAVPPGRIVFAHHFFDAAESGVTGLDERAELARILAGGPETVVYEAIIDTWIPANVPDNEAVRRYVTGCRKVRSFVLHTMEGAFEQKVFSHCGQAG